ncbi:hypothetical protein EVAR_45240_1 [Eumeta japonica]|uniref:Uncharacterized protein n=1 Tax=Eumeta variegata TaxID=151549 RepID=A0A4C1XE21_EUMVA|nr:hypothetical protein EVAR_45240_1 [Eumeta japonica]
MRANLPSRTKPILKVHSHVEDNTIAVDRLHARRPASVLSRADAGSMDEFQIRKKWGSEETSKERSTSNNTIELRPPQPAVTEARPRWRATERGAAETSASPTPSCTEQKFASALMTYFED